MAADLSASRYDVDGVDLATSSAKLTHDGSGLWSGLAEDIAVSTAPGRDGGDIDGGVFKPYTHSTMYQIRAGSYDDVWAEIRALRRRCKPGRTVTLSRVVPDPEGSDSNVEHTTTARRQTDRVEWFGPKAADVDIDWLIAECPWLGDPVAIASAAGTHAVDGDLPTHRMVVTLAAGAARTVTNTNNGHWFTFGAVVPAGGVEVDVEAQTAVAITGGTDLSQYLSWGKVHPLRLEPGSNVITVSAGSAAIDYQPAYQ